MTRTQAFFRTLVLSCLLVLSAQLVAAIPRLSATYDEPIYTAVGYADLTTGDFYWHGVIGHGPLINLFTAWPLLLQPDCPDVVELPGWTSNSSLEFGRAVLEALGPIQTTLVVTRVPVTWLTIILAAFAIRWARSVGGYSAAMVASVLFCFEPNIIAHGQLNTTDMGVAVFGFAGAYVLSRYIQRARTATYIGAGVLLGAAIASKTSGLFYVGAYGLILLLDRLSRPRQDHQHLWRRLSLYAIELSGLLGIAVFVLWAVYGFETGPLVPGGYPVPAPSHWSGLAYQRENLTQGQTTFIAGALYPGGHWSYFPLSLMLKTPLPLLIGMIVSIGLSLRRGLIPWKRSTALIISPLAYLALSVQAGLNIGHRHLLPALPFMLVITSGAVASLIDYHRAQRRWGFWLASALTAWYILGTLQVFPHYLAYFNELAGGPDGGYRYLADSSNDWGQGFYELREYLAKRHSTRESASLPVRLAAFSSVDPSWYDLDFEALPPTESAPIKMPSRFNPEPGLYIISVVPLQGVWVLDPDTYDWFRHREPIARVAHVLNVYEVSPERDGPYRVMQCSDPALPFDSTALIEGFTHTTDAASLNSVLLDCGKSWLYPATGGWVVMSGDTPETPWLQRRLTGVPLTFRQRDHWSHPGLTIYAMPGAAAGAMPDDNTFYVAPPEWSPAQVVQDSQITAGPVATSGPLTFLGYTLQLDEGIAAISTFWRVDSDASRPLSLMAHLLDADGRAIAIADGMGVPIEYWEAGDIIVQNHSFATSIAGDLPPYIQVGAYWLDTMERWHLSTNNDAVSDRILIAIESR